MPGLLRLPLPGHSQDDPPEPLHAVAGWTGSQDWPQDLCAREANFSFSYLEEKATLSFQLVPIIARVSQAPLLNLDISVR